MVMLVLFIPLLGALTTYELAKRFEGHLIRVASALALCFSLITYAVLGPHSLQFELVTILFYAGVFVGMSSYHRFNRVEVLLASLGLSLIFSLIYTQIDLLGGALGFMAFCAVLSVRSIRKVHRTIQKR